MNLAYFKYEGSITTCTDMEEEERKKSVPKPYFTNMLDLARRRRKLVYLSLKILPGIEGRLEKIILIV